MDSSTLFNSRNMLIFDIKHIRISSNPNYLLMLKIKMTTKTDKDWYQ